MKLVVHLPTKDHEHTMRLLRTTGGKAALDLKRRSAHGFNAMCQRAKELFKTFDKDNSGWLECTDLPNLLLFFFIFNPHRYFKISMQ